MKTAVVFFVLLFEYGWDSVRTLPTSGNSVQKNMDPKQCLANPGAVSTKPQIRFGVLPGLGFDNLRNLDAGQVIVWPYQECKSTEDGKYLIPDTLLVVPVKESSLEILADVFENWSSYTSATSHSINVNAGGGYGGVKISGKFSYEFESAKTHQIQDNSMTTRVQVRHTFYTAKVQPDAPLHPTFKSRLLEIAAHMQNNNTEVARYLSQLLIRDYGTHVVTSVDAGAALVKEDHIKNTFMKNDKDFKSKVSASASASFFSLMKFESGFSAGVSKSDEKHYTENRTSSSVKTFGGPAFRTNLTVQYWEDRLENELVAIDRSGEPLHFFVTTTALPELPDPTTEDLANVVQNAIGLYYKFNTFKGCTNKDDPNFSFQANVDDGSCDSPPHSYGFGGVYQTCRNLNTAAGSACGPSLEQVNPLTKAYRCPTGYQNVLLHDGRYTMSVTRRVCTQKNCRKCGWLWKDTCCDTVCENRKYYSLALYEAFWCVALGKVPAYSGYLFGGAYTLTNANIFTSDHSCPLHFYSLRILRDFSVCVSDNYTQTAKSVLPFAGFFSCASGNPLSALPDEKTRSLSSDADVPPSLRQFLTSGGPQTWPKDCPEGFNEHLAMIDGSCEIHFCIRMGSIKTNGLPQITRPPFIPRPSDDPGLTDTLVITGAGGHIWTRNDTVGAWVRIDKPDNAARLEWTKEILEKIGFNNSVEDT